MDHTTDRLQIVNLHKEYESQHLLDGINFTVEGGETLCLLGRSGSGKSTTLRIIAGIESADEGSVFWNGIDLSDVPTWKRNFGLMFQDYALFPHKNVAENVAFGLRMSGIPSAEIHVLVDQSLKMVSMQGFEHRKVTDLSGGEQQRIALARALAPKPRLLMLDEPLAALDKALRIELQEELRELLHKMDIPAIYVTHDQEEAILLGDKVAILADGKIEQIGRPEEVYQFPKNRRVAEFLGMTNFLPGKILSLEPLLVETDCGVFQPGSSSRKFTSIGEPVELLVKMTSVFLDSGKTDNNVLSGVVKDCSFRGEFYQLAMTITKEREMKFFCSNPITIGSQIALVMPAYSILCL